MAAVLDGRRLYARREDLQNVIDITDATASEALAEAIRGQDDTEADARRDIERRVGGRTRAAAGERLSDAQTARLARALTDPQVRDVFYALAVGDGAPEAEALWAVLARTLPDAVAGRSPGVVGVLRLCARGRAAGRGVAGGGASLRCRAPDGGHAGHRAAIGNAA